MQEDLSILEAVMTKIFPQDMENWAWKVTSFTKENGGAEKCMAGVN